MKRLITVILLSLSISACAPAGTKQTEGKYSLSYHVFEIEDMPCVWAVSKFGNTGLSCDWSKWEGR